jgi:CheY-like chemotaxis protein
MQEQSTKFDSNSQATSTIAVDQDRKAAISKGLYYTPQFLISSFLFVVSVWLISFDMSVIYRLIGVVLAIVSGFILKDGFAKRKQMISHSSYIEDSLEDPVVEPSSSFLNNVSNYSEIGTPGDIDNLENGYGRKMSEKVTDPKEIFGKHISEAIASLTDAREFSQRVLNGDNVIERFEIFGRTFETLFAPQPKKKNGNIDFTAITIDVTESQKEENDIEEGSISVSQENAANDFDYFLDDILLQEVPSYNNKRINDPLSYKEKPSQKITYDVRPTQNQSTESANAGEFDLCVMNVNNVLSDMSEMLDRILGSDIKLSLDYSDRIGTITANSAYIEQIIFNLTLNARAAMIDGGELKISTRNIESSDTASGINSNGVVITLSDNGTGMSSETLEKIFEPYFTTQNNSQHQGLGLSSVRKTVENMGGEIQAASLLGIGTTFTIKIPGDVQVLSRDYSQIATERILLVEKDDHLRGASVKVLQRQGYDVLPAKDSNEALYLYSKNNFAFDLIITDVSMENVDGFELYNKINSDENPVKVLYKSRLSTSQYYDKFKRPDTNYLQKPFGPIEVLKRVRDILDS